MGMLLTDKTEVTLIERFKQSFQRECLVWKGLHHEHVLELRGIAEDAIDGGQLCMVIPWMENGNLREYLRNIQAKKVLSSDELVIHVDLWVSVLHFSKGDPHSHRWPIKAPSSSARSSLSP